jgi:hypothetical protein
MAITLLPRKRIEDYSHVESETVHWFADEDVCLKTMADIRVKLMDRAKG